MASDDRTSVVTEFLGAGYSRFSLLNGLTTTETVVGSSIDYFSARLLRDLGLYLSISPVEFQLFDANAEKVVVSADSLLSQSPFRLGPFPLAIPAIRARVPSAQLRYVATALGNPCVAEGCPPPQKEGDTFVPLDPNDMMKFTVPAGLPFSDCIDENALISHADALKKGELLLLIKKHFPSAECDDKTAKSDLIGKFVEHVTAQRAEGLKDLTLASGVDKDSHSSRTSTSFTTNNIVTLQNALSEIRAIVGPPALGNSSYLSAAHLGSLAVQSLCTVVTGQLSLYRTVHGRVNAGAALPQNERFFLSLIHI